MYEYNICLLLQEVLIAIRNMEYLLNKSVL